MSKSRLVLHTKPSPDSHPTLPIDRWDGDGVGAWIPEKKHMLLAKYLDGTRAMAAKWPHRVLIDPFCGPGRLQVNGESFTRDGGALIAWRQSIASSVPFTKVLVGDLNAEKVDACVSRLLAAEAPVTRFHGPAVETAPLMAASVPRGALCLAYLDPYNLEYLSFDIIKSLAALRKVDFVVHFSTMDLFRNVDLELGSRARFDDAAPGWREALKGISAANLKVEFFRYWEGLVKDLGFTFSKEKPLVYNNSNSAIYRLVAFARHDHPLRVWSDVARGPNYDLF